MTLAKLALAQLILIENYQDFDIVDENYDLEMSEILNKSPDIIYNYAVQNKNEIRVAETNVEIAKKSLELNKSLHNLDCQHLFFPVQELPVATG